MNAKRPKLYILCGLSFAGKSTLAKKLSEPLDATIVEADRYISIVEKIIPVHMNKLENWRAIQKLARNEVKELLVAGKSVLYDDLMVDPRDRQELISLADQCGVQVLTVYLDTSVDTVRERQRQSSSSEEKRSNWENHTQLLLSQLVPPDRDKAVYVEPGYEVTDVLEQIAKRCNESHDEGS